MKISSPLLYLLRDPPENIDLFRGYDVFCILATGGNLLPPRPGDIICAIAQWSMMMQAVITTERQTEPVKIRVGHLDNAFRHAHEN